MNENYDKYRQLLTPNAALLVIGEVNNSEDKPKIFPQEIMPLEDAPKKYTRQVHLHLQSAHLTLEQLTQIHQLVMAHPGKCPLLLCFRQSSGELVYIEPNEHFSVAPSRALQQAVDELLGEGSYYAKIDTTLPERAQRRWEGKPKNGGGGEE